jgi:predicted nicotinamide N-methyase
VTVLEASAESQDKLVNLALEDEDGVAGAEGTSLNSGDPYGAVLWPASQTLASLLLSRSDELLQDKTILEVGTGTGLVSLAAALGGAKSVLATDYENIPLQLLDYASKHLNDNRTASILKMQHFDICDLSQPLPAANVLVAADIMYEPKTGRAMAHRAVEALEAGSQVFICDSSGRPGRPHFLKRLKELGVEGSFQEEVGSKVSGERHELICSKESPCVSASPHALMVTVMELSPERHLKKPTSQRK